MAAELVTGPVLGPTAGLLAVLEKLDAATVSVQPVSTVMAVTRTLAWLVVRQLAQASLRATAPGAGT